MTRGKPADLSERERFPEIKAEYGEDPARFLDHDLLERGPSHTARSNKMLVQARIRGIDTLERVRLWKAIERRLERGPRETVIEWLEQRERFLEENGDRRDRLDYDSIPDREERVDRRTAADYEAIPNRTPLLECHKVWGTPSERLAEKARKREEREQSEEPDRDPDLESENESEPTGLPSWEDLGEALDPVAAADGGDSEVSDS